MIATVRDRERATESVCGLVGRAWDGFGRVRESERERESESVCERERVCERE